MSKIKTDPLEPLFRQYPFVGRILKYDPVSGQGTIRGEGLSKDSIPHFPEKIFFSKQNCLNLSNDTKSIVKRSRRHEDDLAGEQCVFAYGGDSRFLSVNSHAIRWAHVDGDLADYEANREEYLKNLDIADLSDILRAQWYVEAHWQSKDPQIALYESLSLFNALTHALLETADWDCATILYSEFETYPIHQISHHIYIVAEQWLQNAFCHDSATLEKVLTQFNALDARSLSNVLESLSIPKVSKCFSHSYSHADGASEKRQRLLDLLQHKELEHQLATSLANIWFSEFSSSDQDALILLTSQLESIRPQIRHKVLTDQQWWFLPKITPSFLKASDETQKRFLNALDHEDLQQIFTTEVINAWLTQFATSKPEPLSSLTAQLGSTSRSQRVLALNPYDYSADIARIGPAFLAASNTEQTDFLNLLPLQQTFTDALVRFIISTAASYENNDLKSLICLLNGAPERIRQSVLHELSNTAFRANFQRASSDDRLEFLKLLPASTGREEAVLQFCKPLIDSYEINHLPFLLKACQQSLLPEEHLTEYAKRIFVEKAAVIDIESDGRSVFEFAIKTNGVLKSLKLSAFGSHQEFLQAIKQAMRPLNDCTVIVGHNSISWDLPILQTLIPDMDLSQCCAWDTLLVGWLCEPWKPTHALVGHSNAHHADADVEATFDLFNSQVAQLPINFLTLIDNYQGSTTDLFNHIGEQLPRVANRTYPEPNTLPPGLNVLPTAQLKTVAWAPKVAYDWPESDIEREHRILNPGRALEYLQNNQPAPHESVLYQILRDAKSKNVQVIEAMIPLWLRQACSEMLEEVTSFRATKDKSSQISVLTYRSLQHSDATTRKSILDSARLHAASFGRFELLHQIENHSNEDIRKELNIDHLDRDSAQLIVPRQEKKRQESEQKTCQWLEYHPNRRKDPKPWTSWKSLAIPNLGHHDINKEQDDYNTNINVINWVDPDSQQTVDFNSIWPSTANRYQYWLDTLTRVYSLLEDNQQPEDTFFLLLLEDGNELHVIRQAFEQLYLILPQKDEQARTQYLQNCRKFKYRLAVTTVDQFAEWIEIADELRIHLHPILTSLPLYQWLMCSDQFETDDLDLNVFEENLEDQDDDINEGRVDPPSEFEIKTSSRPFKEPATEEIFHAFQTFLSHWVATYFSDSPVTILDARLQSMALRLGHLCTIKNAASAPLPKKMKRDFQSFREDLGDIQRESPPQELQPYEDFFVKHWGRNNEEIQGFKPDTQRPVIETILSEDNHLLVRLPTGEGKSILFQVPALLRGLKTKRLTLVITPLKALMQDQTNALWKLGFIQSVEFINGDRESWQNSETLQGVIDNRIKLLFVAPERFRIPAFRAALERRYTHDEGLEFLVVDEAHCISQWGYDFRPDYLHAMEQLNTYYPEHRKLFFSATVTQAVEQDLKNCLEVPNHTKQRTLTIKPLEYRHPVQNHIDAQGYVASEYIFYSGRNFDEKRKRVEKRTDDLLEILDKNRLDYSQSITIVFANERIHTEWVADFIGEKRDDLRVSYFHAGLPDTQRMEIYEETKTGGVDILVATKAFGMGMDIPNIHQCIHLSPPTFLEDYLQEIGRTGRNRSAREKAGLKNVTCTLLYHADDFETNLRRTIKDLIQRPDLESLWERIWDKSELLADNRRVCVLHEDACGDLKNTRLRKALSWLERQPAERIEILANLPNVLKIRLNRKRLKECAVQPSAIGKLAKEILLIYDEPTPKAETTDPNNSGSRQADATSVGGYLRTFLGFLFTQTDYEEAGPNDQPSLKPVDASPSDFAEINVTRLYETLGYHDRDAIFKDLTRLQHERGIQIEKRIRFESPEREHEALLWNWTEQFLLQIIKPRKDENHLKLDAFIKQPSLASFDTPYAASLTPQRMRTLQARCYRTCIKLCNRKGMRIREGVDADLELINRVEPINRQVCQRVKRRIERTIKLAKEIASRVTANGDDIWLTELIDMAGKRLRIRDIHDAIRLLSDLRLVSTQDHLIPRSYILTLKRTDPLLGAKEPAAADQAMYDSLAQVNRMTELRCYAMQLYAMQSSKDRQREFVDQYFDCQSPDDLALLLTQQADVVTDSAVNEDMKRIAEQVQQKTMAAELDKLEKGEEPNQFHACAIPWQEHALVNAGPGAGKTHVLMMRAAHLIHKQGIKPHQILILAFNRAVVHEIQERIRALFDSLGYGSYVNAIRVKTFHGFARQHMGDNFYEQTADRGEKLNQNLHAFIDKCKQDQHFARHVVGELKCILVDEFQDMNDDRYDLLIHLQKASGAGIMVIGDDDQDILRWDRKHQAVQHEGLAYFNRFTESFPASHRLELKVNFRSAHQIVERSQKLLSSVLNNNSIRLKENIALIPHSNAAEGIAEKLDEGEFSPENLIERVKKATRQPDQSVAILCRTNAEVETIYESLRWLVPQLKVQGQAQSSKITALRHVALWLDICKRQLIENESADMDSDMLSRLKDEYIATAIPEVKQQKNKKQFTGEVSLQFLWDATKAVNPRALLADHVNFLRELQIQDYQRIHGKHSQSRANDHAQILISTIHKVKGLEFDTVFVVPSKEKLTYQGEEESEQKRLLSDEARTYYVALTRAKTNLYFGIGKREEAWIHNKGDLDSHSASTCLAGNPDEVFLSWPGFDDALQEYIEKNVATNDPVELRSGTGSYYLRHKSKTIGFIERTIKKKLIRRGAIRSTSLRVQSVIIYPVTLESIEKYSDITDRCKQQGWNYVVLIAGIIRH